ncbi:MAG: type II toxin-antitoxin system VapC family toxin [Gaiellaceae bacterium]
MLVLDASALVKRYVQEAGTDDVVALMASDSGWCASALCRAETHVMLCHRGFEEAVQRGLARSLEADWEHFVVVPVDDLCLARAAEIGCDRRSRTLDAIHLAAADRLPRPFTFVTFDVRQAEGARSLGFEVAGVE